MHNENNKNLKPKNLKKSLSRLIKELNKYKILIIISLFKFLFVINWFKVNSINSK